MRRIPLALPFVLASTLVLVGCAGEPEATPTDGTETPVSDVAVCDAPAGDAVESVSVTGDLGAAPTVEFSAPLEVSESERVVLEQGEEVEPGTLVAAAYTLYNGTTGDQLESFGYAEGETLTYFRGDYDNIGVGFAKTLGCLGPGSRAVGVIPGSEGFGASGEQLGIGADDVLVFVVDIVSDAAWTTDLPEVGGTAEQPTVTLPGTPPPTDLRIAVLEEGDGAVVGPADSVTVNYLGTAWETGEIFDSSYDRGQPATFQVQGVVQGFAQALIGQKVGSRVIVTMPPSLGYGASEGHELQDSTLVFLVDIVDVTPAG